MSHYMKTAEGVLCFVEVKDVPHSKADDIWVVLTINGQDKDRKRTGQLQLAGGGIEGNETHSECIQREVRDELNLALETTDFHKIGKDNFTIIGYELGKLISITVHLMYTCIGYKDFSSIKSHTNDETLEIRLMEIKEVMSLGGKMMSLGGKMMSSGEEILRPGTLSHINHLMQSRMQGAASQ